MQAWVEEELRTSDFGDVRLDERFRLLMDELSQKPSVSIPAACEGWNEIQAAYRFFENERVSPEKILQPHRQSTLKRIAAESVVLLIQDTTELDVTRPQERMKGAGPLNDESRWGFYDHPLLAVTPNRIPLGVVHAKIWSRDLEEFRKHQQEKKKDRWAKAKKKKRPIEEKESVRWLEGYREGCKVAAEVPQTEIVVVSDSEGDVYEYYEETTKDRTKKARWLVRACQDRNLSNAEEGAYTRLRETLASTRVLGKAKVVVRERPPSSASDEKRDRPRSARTATVTIQAARVKLRGPQRPGGRPPDVQVNAVLVREKNPPPGEEPIEWLLLTDLPISTLKKVQQVIAYYCCRWQIEIYFKVLKSGCRIEDRQFEDAERYLPCLSLYMIIAWRVMYVMMLGRECPEMSCAEIFSEAEWKSVYTVVCHEPAPKRPPTLEAMIPMIAGLGGYIGRKHDGPPGPKTMWIGMQRMMDLALAWNAFGPPAQAGKSGKR
jgi:hypothetical protein